MSQLFRSIQKPPDGAVDQFNNLVVRWESAKADAYDLYLGFSEDTLELYLENVKESAVEVRDLLLERRIIGKLLRKIDLATQKDLFGNLQQVRSQNNQELFIQKMERRKSLLM